MKIVEGAPMVPSLFCVLIPGGCVRYGGLAEGRNTRPLRMCMVWSV